MNQVSHLFSKSALHFEKHINQLHLQSEPQALYLPIQHILSLKGKRIRPIITLIVYQLLGKKIDKKILNTSIAIELFHNFTLIHDDIIDQSDYRRGKPAVHKKFGINAGILSGDALMILAYQQLEKLPNNYFPKILQIFNLIAIKICEGQQFDILFETQEKISIDDYFKMIELKTAVLLGLSFQLGGLIANVNVEEEKLLYQIGKDLGIAYQIQDDYLDTYGQFEKLGKPIGNDILLNKKTFLSVYASINANKNQLLKLKKAKNETQKEIKIATTKKIFDELGVEQEARKIIQELYDKIYENLDKVKLMNKVNKLKMKNIIKLFIDRQF